MLRSAVFPCELFIGIYDWIMIRGSGHCSIDQNLNLSELREAYNKPFLQSSLCMACIMEFNRVFNLFNNYIPPSCSKQHHEEYGKYKCKVYFLYTLFTQLYLASKHKVKRAWDISFSFCNRLSVKSFWQTILTLEASQLASPARKSEVTLETAKRQESEAANHNLLTPSTVFAILQTITSKAKSHTFHDMSCVQVV